MKHSNKVIVELSNTAFVVLGLLLAAIAVREFLL